MAFTKELTFPDMHRRQLPMSNGTQQNNIQVPNTIKSKSLALTTLYRPMHHRSNKICPENPLTKANQSWNKEKLQETLDYYCSTCFHSQ